MESTIHDQISILYHEACKHPAGSPRRNRCLNRIYILITKEGRSHLYPPRNESNTSFYDEILHEALSVFLMRLCSEYDPGRGKILSWFNNYFLRNFLRDRARKKMREIRKKATPVVDQDGKEMDPIETIADDHNTVIDYVEVREIRLAVSALVDDIHTNPAWVECHIKDRPDINCKLLLDAKGFNSSMDTSIRFSDLAKQLGVSNSTADTHYRRRCIPMIKDFLRSKGLDPSYLREYLRDKS